MHAFAQYNEELQVALRLAAAAGDAIMSVYNSGLEVEYKGGELDNPVTRADKEANDIIVAGLQAAFPADGILAEETPEAAEDIARRQACRRLWCIDPVDGTREFVGRSGEFIVMIGLAVEGRAVAGVLFQPTERRMFAGSGTQAMVQDAAGTRRLRVSEVAEPSAATLAISKRHRSHAATRALTVLGTQRTLAIGSVGLKVASLCEARADVYISTSTKTHEWDSCGPEALLKAAGGRFTDVAGEPLRYNCARTNTAHGLLGSNGVLHDLVRGCVAAEGG